MRSTPTAVLVLFLIGCGADSNITPHSPDAGQSDAQAETAPETPVVKAEHVSVEPLPEPFDGTNVQAVLSQMVAALEDLADVGAALDALAGVPAAVAGLDARVLELEAVPTPAVPTAAEVSFDDSGTNRAGSTVQDFGEALDTAMTELLATSIEADAWMSDADDAIASNAEAAAAVSEDLAALKKTANAHGWSGGITVEVSPIVSEPIFDMGEYGYGHTVHDGLQIIWSHVRAIGQWHEDQTNTPFCPPEMTSLVSDVWICVDKQRAKAAMWASAAQICQYAGKRLCRPSEFIHYCYTPQNLDPLGEGPNVGIPAPEWVEGVVGTTEPRNAALYGAECDQMVTHPMTINGTKTEYFRCCKDPRPNLPPLPEPSPIPKGVEIP